MSSLSNAALSFPPPPASDTAEALRAEVRAFLATELADVPATKRMESWSGFDPAFSRKLGARGWIGMTFPTEYGGHGRTNLERYVVIEELLAAGAPVVGHWISDRQSGPSILRFGTEAQKRFFIPKIVAGECFFCIGMSEPNSGSDLASVRTRATKVDGGWRINGTKLWTSQAHQAHYMILFCRSSGTPDDRQAGTSQFLVDMKSTPGMTIRPVHALTGEHHFNEIHFQDAFVPDDALLGDEGQGWHQVTSELAYERSGPERFLSSFILLVETLRVLGQHPSERATIAIGRLGAHLVTLRRLSRSVAGMLEAGQNPATQAALVKDLGALLEQEIPDIARDLVAIDPPSAATERFAEVLAYTTLHAPSFSLRGGTREILRGIIARGLGLR